MTRPISFLFALWEGGGNVTPTLEVVRKLVARGHRLRFMSDAYNRAEAEAVGATIPTHSASLASQVECSLHLPIASPRVHDATAAATTEPQRSAHHLVG